jgi:serine O-acetyltransferase
LYVGVIETAAAHAAAVDWHANRLYRLARWLWTHDYHGLARLVAAANRILTSVDIPPTAAFGEGLLIMHGSGIVVHPDAVVGQGCVIYQQVTIGSSSADGKPPILGDRVTLYPGAKVLGPVIIGDGVRIGANALVMSDVPAGGTVRAKPSEVIGS